MADIRNCPREFLTEFIDLYQSFPCLWRVKSKEYCDRDKKAKAYGKLVEKYREVDAEANRETVVKKINSLRSVFRKELCKVNSSIRSGAGEEEMYKPALWYFDMLHFLNDHETPRASRNTIFEGEENGAHGRPKEAEEDEHERAVECEEGEGRTTPLSAESSTVSSQILSDGCSTSNVSTRKRKAAPKEDATDEVLKVVGKRLESLKEEDAFEVFGKHVAHKLRGIASSRNIFAEKLISDVLFEAELGALNRQFKIIDMTSQGRNDFQLVNERQCQQNMAQQFRIPNTSYAPVQQYQSFSQLAPPAPQPYIPQASPHSVRYETRAQNLPVSQIQPREGNENEEADVQQSKDGSALGSYFSTFKLT